MGQNQKFNRVKHFPCSKSMWRKHHKKFHFISIVAVYTRSFRVNIQTSLHGQNCESSSCNNTRNRFQIACRKSDTIPGESLNEDWANDGGNGSTSVQHFNSDSC